MRFARTVAAVAAAFAVAAGLAVTVPAPAGADIRAVEIDKSGCITDGGAGARLRVAVTADRGDLVAITLNVYEHRGLTAAGPDDKWALDVDGNAWWGWVKFGDQTPGAPVRMIVEMGLVPTIYGRDQEFVPGRAQAYAVVTVVRPDGSVQFWRMPAEGLQPVTLKAASPRR